MSPRLVVSLAKSFANFSGPGIGRLRTLWEVLQ
jgi:hypothetical protein